MGQFDDYLPFDPNQPQQFQWDRAQGPKGVIDPDNRIDPSQKPGTLANPKMGDDLMTDLMGQTEALFQRAEKSRKVDPELEQHLKALHDEGWIDDKQHEWYQRRYEKIFEGIPQS